ncbi:MAG: ATP-binding protein [Polyangiaceae bacterium]
MARGDDPGSARRDLAAAVHETTNALTVILGWLARARDACHEPEVLDSLERAQRYTQNARRVMRRAIGASEPEADPAAATDIARRVEQDLAVEAARAGVDLAVDDSLDELVLLGHPDEAWQILTNLVLNARAVTPAGGSVIIHAEPSESGVAFHVDDDGPGVPAADRDAIFGGTSKRQGGAGIGLRHARALARELGGDLELADPPDGGARFTLHWPRLPPETPPSLRPKRRKGKGPSLHGKRVLLLEDDAAVVELLELSLGARGAELSSVTTAAACEAALDAEPFDVLLMDLSPLGGGDEALLEGTIQRARAKNPVIDVVIISGSVTLPSRNDVTWVRKPFEPRELADRIAASRPHPPPDEEA